MGFDLIPKRKNINPHWVCFSEWRALLMATGCNYLLKFGGMISDKHKYIYVPDKHGSPVANDGYVVSRITAKQMSKQIEGYIIIQKENISLWKSLSDSEKEDVTPPPSDEFINECIKLSLFCIKSGGFSIK